MLYSGHDSAVELLPVLRHALWLSVPAPSRPLAAMGSAEFMDEKI
jgi:hypothetical protein